MKKELSSRPHLPLAAIGVGVFTLISLLLAGGILFLGGCVGSNGEGSAADLAKVQGSWQRPDGGYILELDSTGAGNRLKASYFNPRLINVSKAELSRKGSAVRVFVELDDTGYPGCTYNLTYEPEQDILQGIYHQAAMQQDFEVVFIRMKKSP